MGGRVPRAAVPGVPGTSPFQLVGEPGVQGAQQHLQPAQQQREGAWELHQPQRPAVPGREPGRQQQQQQPPEPWLWQQAESPARRQQQHQPPQEEEWSSIFIKGCPEEADKLWLYEKVCDLRWCVGLALCRDAAVLARSHGAACQCWRAHAWGGSNAEHPDTRGQPQLTGALTRPLWRSLRGSARCTACAFWWMSRRVRGLWARAPAADACPAAGNRRSEPVVFPACAHSLDDWQDGYTCLQRPTHRLAFVRRRVPAPVHTAPLASTPSMQARAMAWATSITWTPAQRAKQQMA